MAESVDAPDLESGGTPLLLGETSCASSTLATRTKPHHDSIPYLSTLDSAALSKTPAANPAGACLPGGPWSPALGAFRLRVPASHRREIPLFHRARKLGAAGILKPVRARPQGVGREQTQLQSRTSSVPKLSSTTSKNLYLIRYSQMRVWSIRRCIVGRVNTFPSVA